MIGSSTMAGPAGGHITIYGKDEPPESPFGAKAGDVFPADFDDPLSLDGISFRCGPPGQNGCP